MGSPTQALEKIMICQVSKRRRGLDTETMGRARRLDPRLECTSIGGSPTSQIVHLADDP